MVLEKGIDQLGTKTWGSFSIYGWHLLRKVFVPLVSVWAHSWRLSFGENFCEIMSCRLLVSIKSALVWNLRYLYGRKFHLELLNDGVGELGGRRKASEVAGSNLGLSKYLVNCTPDF